MAFEEKELILLVSKGNEHAFSLLFRQYHLHLASFVYKLTDSYELTEEIVQDVFLKIWINRKQLTKVKNFKAYLFTVSKNHSINCLKQVVKERAHRQHWEEEYRHLPDGNELTGYHFLLDQAIEALPPQQQKVYVLSKQQQLKYTEIADQMGISKETVKSYLKLATSTIIGYLKKHIYLLLLLIKIKF
ncbi:sigma-70 family RNA polymerase sigma factor [Olivibacter sp. CPCC 100613]|uniref:RNA polymerase sigma factor n=1 Tax=Olivibacter sp. CPCC 100613 TaxID=3079931 RepID=UPI002FF45166